MAYTNSSLITCTKLSPNYTADRKCINRITIHHTATDPINASRIGEIFATKKRGASCNYGIGNDGSICLIVEEKNRAWTSSNPTNDRSAITYEVSNSKYGEPWTISDKAMPSIIALSIDVCKRNGITEVFNIQREIMPIAQANRAMFANNYDVPQGKCLLTQHNYFASTACPGTYLKDFDRWDYITNEINKGLKGVTPAPTPKPVVDVALPTIAKGNKGAKVKLLQQNLMAVGIKLPKYGADGDFGQETFNAVVQLQKQGGLVQDGIYGKKSYTYLKSLLNR